MTRDRRSQVWIGRTATAVRSVFLAASAVAAGIAVIDGWSGAAAQTAKVPDDLRPLYANSSDVAEGRRLAESTCAGCHGANGVSESIGVPHLAGQRAPYL